MPGTSIDSDSKNCGLRMAQNMGGILEIRPNEIPVVPALFHVVQACYHNSVVIDVSNRSQPRVKLDVFLGCSIDSEAARMN